MPRPPVGSGHASAGPGEPHGSDPGDLAALAGDLTAWFLARDRDVPWRRERDPYRIWVAEVMAQQTRVGTVAPYYRRWLERFPDVHALAGAELDDVLKAWEGLGYYARARNLHTAAREVVARYGGELPAETERLRRLPGVGPYTAGAVASLAFGRREPAVDGNARRVLSRLFDLEEPTPGRLDRAARRLLSASAGEAAALNQALMDLGGAVCTPRRPSCGACPVRPRCLAFERGTVSRRPPARKKRAVPHHEIGVGVVWKGDRILVARRPEDALLGGLWEFPGGKIEADETPEEAVVRELREEMEIQVEVRGPIARIDHAYSHFKVTLHAFDTLWLSGDPTPRAATAWAWVAPDRLSELPFPAASLRIIQAIRDAGAPADRLHDPAGRIR